MYTNTNTHTHTHTHTHNVREEKSVPGFGAEAGSLKEKYDGRHCFKLEDNIKIGVKNILID